MPIGQLQEIKRHYLHGASKPGWLPHPAVSLVSLHVHRLLGVRRSTETRAWTTLRTPTEETSPLLPCLQATFPLPYPSRSMLLGCDLFSSCAIDSLAKLKTTPGGRRVALQPPATTSLNGFSVTSG